MFWKENSVMKQCPRPLRALKDQHLCFSFKPSKKVSFLGLELGLADLSVGLFAGLLFAM